MTSSPISRPVGSVKKTLQWSAAYSTSPHLLQPAAVSPAACPGVPGGAEPCLVALSLHGPWVYSQRMPCRHPAHQTWLQWNTLLGAHLVTHHWDCSLSFFRGNTSIYLWTVPSQIPATRAFNNCPQTFLQFAFSVPRVFKSFPCVTSLPIPFSPSLKIASYMFYLFFYFYFLLVKAEFQETWDAGSYREAGRGSAESQNNQGRLEVLNVSHWSWPQNPQFWSASPLLVHPGEGAVGRNPVHQEASDEQRHHFCCFSSPQFLPQPPSPHPFLLFSQDFLLQKT